MFMYETQIFNGYKIGDKIQSFTIVEHLGMKLSTPNSARKTRKVKVICDICNMFKISDLNHIKRGESWSDLNS
jgi:hypothetical protein